MLINLPFYYLSQLGTIIDEVQEDLSVHESSIYDGLAIRSLLL